MRFYRFVNFVFSKSYDVRLHVCMAPGKKRKRVRRSQSKPTHGMITRNRKGEANGHKSADPFAEANADLVTTVPETQPVDSFTDPIHVSTDSFVDTHPQTADLFAESDSDSSADLFAGFSPLPADLFAELSTSKADSFATPIDTSTTASVRKSVDLFTESSSSITMAEKDSEGDLKNPDIIFTGKMYSAWRERLIATFAKKKLRDLLRESDDEIAYRKLLPSERETKMSDYDDRQWAARAIIYDRLDTAHLERIRNCVTVRDIVEKLDGEHQSKSLISQIRHRSNYLNYRFSGGENMLRFLNEHERRAQAYKDTGVVLSDLDQVMQLHISLPTSYDSIIDAFNSLSLEEKTYATYRELLLNKQDRMVLMNAPFHRRSKQFELCDENGKPDGERCGRRKCYNCHGFGHESKDCPSPKSDEKPDDTNGKAVVPVEKQAQAASTLTYAQRRQNAHHM